MGSQKTFEGLKYPMRHKSLNRRFVCSIGSLLVIAALPQLSFGAQSEHLSIPDLEVIAKANIDALKNIETTYTTKQQVTAGKAPSGIVPSMRVHILWDCESGRFREKSLITRSDGRQDMDDVIAFDGKVQTGINRVTNQGYVRERKDDNSAPGLMPILALGYMMRPHPVPGRDDGSIVTLLQESTLRPKTEDINGVTCYVCDATKNGVRFATAWIDPSRGAVPIRVDMYGRGSNGTSVAQEQTIVAMKKFTDDKGAVVWLPSQVQVAISYSAYKVAITTELDPERTKINISTNPGDFQVKFPTSAQVFDEESGTLLHLSSTQPSGSTSTP